MVRAAASVPRLSPPPVPWQMQAMADARIGDFAFGSRAMAMSIPTVAACRNLICGTVSQLDVRRTRGEVELDAGSLLSRPDPDSTWAATVAATVDDLLFYGRAYWIVLAYDGIASERNPRGMPVRARYLPAAAVAERVTDDYASYSRLEGYEVGGSKLPADALIPFRMGNEGILTYGATTLLAVYQLEAAARRLSAVELPAGVLRNTGHEVSEADAREIVRAFQAARQTDGIAFLQGFEYSRESLAPADLQLIEARAIGATECARLFGVPVALVGASPTGNASAMLYANLGATQASLLTSAVAPLLRVIESTLSGPAVTPQGQTVTFNAGQWLRADPTTAADYAVKLLEAGILSVDEARSYLGVGPAAAVDPAAAPATLTPGTV
jgi:Phage portal protein